MNIRFRRLLQVTALAAFLCILGFSSVVSHAQTPCEPLADDKGKLSFAVNVPADGTYIVWLRFAGASAEHDSLLLQIDGQCSVVAGDSPGLEGLVWTSAMAGEPGALRFALATGQHTITFGGRNEKTGLDKFILTDNPNCIPVDLGTNCLVEEAMPEEPETITAITKPGKSWWILIICIITGLSALGFLLWKFFRFMKTHPASSAPLTDFGNAVADRLRPETRFLIRVGHFITQHRLTVATCTTLIVISTVVGFVFAANNSSFEAEDGTLAGDAQIVDDASMSNGKYVLFDSNPVVGDTAPAKTTKTNGGGSTGSGGSTGGGSGGGGGVTPPPSDCQPYPDADCTGWQHTGVTLKTCSLPLVDPTYDSCLFTGEVNVSASNVAITRSKIVGVVNYRTGDNGSLFGLTLTDVEIDSSGWDQAAIGNNDYTCTRCHVHGGQRGANLGSNVTVQDSYLHGWFYNPGDHITGLSGHGGSNNTVKHNNISCDITNDPGGAGCSAGMSVYGDDAPGNDNWTITNNLFNSGSSFCVTIVGPPSKPYPFTNINFTNNKFGSDAAAYWGVPASQCTEYGPINTQSASWGVNGNVWSGNTNALGGTVNP